MTAKLVNQTAAIFAFAVSISASIGWLAQWPILTSWISSGTKMVPETAVAIFFGGMGLWLAQRRKGRLIAIIGGLLLLIGLVNLVLHSPLAAMSRLAEAVGDWSRMAQGSALACILLGAGLVLFSKANGSRAALWVVALLGNGVVVIGLLSLLAYMSGLNSAPWWGSFFLKMALPTAVSCCALGIALVSIFFQQASGTSQQFSVSAAVMAILGLLLLFAGVDAAVFASSASIFGMGNLGRQAWDDMQATHILVESVREEQEAQRGYILTGDRQHLSDFRRYEQAFERAVRDGSLRELKVIETARLNSNELKRNIALEEAGRHDEAVAWLKSAHGLRLMDELYNQQKAITDEWQNRLAFAQGVSQRSILSIQKTILWSFGMAVLFAVGTLVLIAAEMRRRSRIEAELRMNDARIHEELRTQRVRAEEANQAKSSFLASMSHEIRTPMNAILGMADMLWESELAQTQRHYVEIFRRAGSTLLTLINDILDFSKIESGNFQLERVDFDLGEMVDQLLEILAPKAEAKGVALNAYIEPGTSLSVIGDSVRLQQVLVNLLGNGLKFTEAGSVSLSIRSRNMETHANLEFKISDTGIGIPKDKLSCIFEDFTQAESSITRRFGGTGLGLGISQRIVNRMGGELKVVSELGEGSTFFFNVQLPISFDQQNARTAEFVEIAGKRVLIADNSATSRAILGGMCAAWGMLVTTCGSGAEALEFLKTSPAEEPFVLALVDRLMVGMDGFEAAIQMRAFDPKISILMVSSESVPGDISRCQELGLSGYLLKPVRRATLLKQIVEALRDEVESSPALVVERSENTQNAERVKVLAAEDSDDNRFLLEAYCSGTDYELTFAHDGALAVQAYQGDAFDLVIMDVQMPVMDGLTATRSIRAIEKAAGQKHTPILALTANALPEDVIKAHEAGCDAHLAKPVSKKSFLATLEQWRVKVGIEADPMGSRAINDGHSVPELVCA